MSEITDPAKLEQDTEHPALNGSACSGAAPPIAQDTVARIRESNRTANYSTRLGVSRATDLALVKAKGKLRSAARYLGMTTQGLEMRILGDPYLLKKWFPDVVARQLLERRDERERWIRSAVSVGQNSLQSLQDEIAWCEAEEAKANAQNRPVFPYIRARKAYCQRLVPIHMEALIRAIHESAELDEMIQLMELRFEASLKSVNLKKGFHA